MQPFATGGREIAIISRFVEAGQKRSLVESRGRLLDRTLSPTCSFEKRCAATTFLGFVQRATAAICSFLRPAGRVAEGAKKRPTQPTIGEAEVIYIAARLAALGSILWAVTSVDASTSNVDWRACLLAPPAVGVALYFWLGAMRERGTADWTQSLSIKQPFWPMVRYPVRYWLVVGASLVISGLARFANYSLKGVQASALCASFALLGVAILLALAPYIALDRPAVGDRRR
jgi:hypothetical protein